MKAELIDEKRNEYMFHLTRKETVERIFRCLSHTNPTIREKDIYRDPNSKEYKARYVDGDGFEANISVGIGNLKRYFGSRLIKLRDDGGIDVRRIVPVQKIDGNPLTVRL